MRFDNLGTKTLRLVYFFVRVMPVLGYCVLFRTIMAWLNSNSLFRSVGFAASLLIALMLAVQYAGAWYWIEIVTISKEGELERYLEDLGQSAVLGLADVTDSAFELKEEESEEASNASLTDLAEGDFKRFAGAARLESLTLLDTEGRIVLSTTEPDMIRQPFDFLELDRDAFQSAIKGRSAGSLAYETDSAAFKRVYVPVMAQGSIQGALCLTAGRDYLGEIGKLKASMRILTTISSVLTLLIGWLVYRLLERQRTYERQSARADRLSSLGTLAAGFAHEVRNPLEIIGACAEDLERSLAESPNAPKEAAETCRDISEEVERMNRLVGQFLQYSKPETSGDQTPASIAQSLKSAVGMLKHAAEKRGVALDAALDSIPESARVTLPDGGLKQVVVNLVMNAIQATPAGGRVEIETLVNGRAATMRFADTGPGIPAAIRPRIFDPFFTTRSEGSGLGLAIAHQLATRHGGNLEYEDRNDSGACFILTLPLVEKSEA